MKKLMVVLTVAAFALAAQAGEKGDKNKAACSVTAKTSSSASSSDCCQSGCGAKAQPAKKLAPVTAKGASYARN